MSISSDQALLINQLPISQDLPKDAEKMHETLSLFIKRISNITNTKSGGLFSQQEFSNSEIYQLVDPQTQSNVYRKCFNLTQLNGGNIGAAATVNFPHNINFNAGGAGALLLGTLIYAGCTSTTNERFSVMGYPTLYLTNTDIFFTNPTALTLSTVYAVCEYLKN